MFINCIIKCPKSLLPTDRELHKKCSAVPHLNTFGQLGRNNYQMAFRHLNKSLVKMGLDARKPDFVVCEKQRPRPACSFAHVDKHFCYMTGENPVS